MDIFTYLSDNRQEDFEVKVKNQVKNQVVNVKIEIKGKGRGKGNPLTGLINFLCWIEKWV